MSCAQNLIHQIKTVTMRKVFFLSLALISFSFASFAQLRKIPAEVTDAFSKKYPRAEDVEYKDVLTSIHVHFVQDSIQYIAKFHPKGEWKETEKLVNYDHLSAELRDGFQKSKFAQEWKVKEAVVLYLPSGAEQIRLKVEKNEVQKKYLFYDEKGRLLRDALTL